MRSRERPTVVARSATLYSRGAVHTWMSSTVAIRIEGAGQTATSVAAVLSESLNANEAVSRAPTQVCEAYEDISESNPFLNYLIYNKVEGRGIHKCSHYFEVYNTHLAHFIGQEVHIVEIGIQSGGSLEMWKHVFGRKAHVYGIDIDPAVRSFADEQTRIFVGDQADRSFWATFREQAPRIDILIDDGGHLAEMMTVTLEEILPHMSPNGVYLIEDIHGDAHPMWKYLTDEI